MNFDSKDERMADCEARFVSLTQMLMADYLGSETPYLFEVKAGRGETWRRYGNYELAPVERWGWRYFMECVAAVGLTCSPRDPGMVWYRGPLTGLTFVRSGR